MYLYFINIKRSRNQSISVNENDPIIYESNKVNDSVEYRNHSNSLCYDKLFRYWFYKKLNYVT